MRIGFQFSAGIAVAAVLTMMAGAAWPQNVSVTPDFSALQAQVNSVQNLALAVQGSIPQPCNVVPSLDTLNGSVGSGSCYTRPSDTRPTVVQAALATTDTTGAWAITWAKPFASVTPYLNPQAINPPAAQPIVCNVTSSTSTGATGRCWIDNVMQLPGVAVNLLNLQLVGSAASIQVRVVGRDLTQ